MRAIVLIFLLSGCASLQRFDEGHDSVAIVQANGGGITSLFKGKISTCTVIASRETEIKVKSLEFDASSNKCKATVGIVNANQADRSRLDE